VRKKRTHDPWLVVIVDGHSCIVSAKTGMVIGYDAEFDPKRISVEIPPFKDSGIKIGEGIIKRCNVGPDKGKDFVTYVLAET